MTSRPERIATILARNVLAARTAARMTQQKLARLSDVSRATIAQIEAGLADPKMSTVLQLASALQIPPLLLVLGTHDISALADLLERNPDDPRLRPLGTADIARIRHYVSSGLLKDRISAAKAGAAAARSAGYSESAAVGAGIGSVIEPGRGAVVAALIASLLSSETPVRSDAISAG